MESYGAGGVAQVIEHMLETLSSNPSIAKANKHDGVLGILIFLF
jgi:hypothetical protein